MQKLFKCMALINTNLLGLGEYLHSLDSSLDVEGHIMRCVRYRRADFDRDVDAQCLEAGDSDRSAGSMWQKMMSLPDAETSAAYTELCSRLEADTTELASLHEQSHKEKSFKADGPHISWLRSIKSAENIDMQQYRDSTAVNRIGASVGYQMVQAQDHYESASQQHYALIGLLREPNVPEEPLQYAKAQIKELLDKL
ncbi:hypothetical protein E4U40_004576 [Claviceps sp. LM458 group G5]|nr:hypothetical protein E4U40_004576 [Claviceps sp. LM458 group G5]